MSDNQSKTRERSVNNLQRLYTVVISLAITESLRRTFGDIDAGTWPDSTTLLACASLIFTVIPFYHGANRYLDATYILGERHARRYALIVDYIVLFVEALAFFLLGVLTIESESFFLGLMALLAVDVIWIGVTKLMSMDKHEDAPYRIWAAINIGAIVAMAITFYLGGGFSWRNPVQISLVMFSIVLVRTIMDYATVWRFYVPPATEYAMPIPRPAPIPPAASEDS